LAVIVALPSLGAGAGFLAISVDSVPTRVYVDATTVLLSDGPRVVEAEPGKHFVSLSPPVKVYRATKEQAPVQFWDRLRSLGALGDEYGLLASYEAGAVRAGTNWVYVIPDETLAVTLSHVAADRAYQRDSGCATRTFLGWAALIGVAMVLSVFLTAINP
jgi:hypothetical protein